jgi:translation elongation factor EF-Tu-like GTPase
MKSIETLRRKLEESRLMRHCGSHRNRIQHQKASIYYAHTDCSGHADFIKNMISGVTQMDGAILVVAANDGQIHRTLDKLESFKHGL